MSVEWPPKKLPRDFPLTIHARGYVKSGIGWICGKKTPAEALQIYHDKAKAKVLNKPPKPLRLASGDRQTVEQLAGRYLDAREADAQRGDLRHSTFSKMESAIGELLEHVVAELMPDHGGLPFAQLTIGDLKPDDLASFADAMRADAGDAGASTICRYVAGMFNYADAEDWIDRPVKFGRRFRKAAWSKRAAFKSTPPPPADVRKLLSHLDDRLAQLKSKRSKRRKNRMDTRPISQFKAQVLLALNGGYGSSELAQLPRAVVDLTNGVIDYDRGKTGEKHKVPLWPETIAALKIVEADALASRPDDELMFRTREGRPWCWEAPSLTGEHVNTVDNTNQWFGKVMRKLKIKRPRHGFYSLRDLHCTLGDESGDQGAAYALTGHSIHSKGRDPYVTVSRERLDRVVHFIRQRIFPSADAAPESPLVSGQNAKKA